VEKITSDQWPWFYEVVADRALRTGRASMVVDEVRVIGLADWWISSEMTMNPDLPELPETWRFVRRTDGAAVHFFWLFEGVAS
jgi:hypothetical protein